MLTLRLERVFARIAWLGALAALTTFGGCDDNEPITDVTPPAIPNGVYSVTADQLILLRWNPNREPDLAGYHVLSNTDGGPEYFIIATIGAKDARCYVDQGTDDPADDFLEYADFDVVNGEYYWYAVIAYDQVGNESELSFENVVDVPRPEGPVKLSDRVVNPALSGYDFGSLSGQPQPWNLASTDVYYETQGGGIPYLLVPSERVRVQDYGNVGFDVATYAPLDGWSRAGRVEAIEGHTYIFRIASPQGFGSDDHYAKLTVVEITGPQIDLDWGYQIVPGERELKQPPRTGPSRMRSEEAAP